MRGQGYLMTDTEQYVTRDELAVRLAELELRLVERMDAMENRLSPRMSDLALTQLRYIQGLYAAVIVGVAILVAAKVFG
jgi:hypothetical protein